MECIICKDNGVEILNDNIHCKCKYKYHSSCWIDYVHSTNKIICLLCRKDLTVKQAVKSTSSQTPYTSQVRTISVETNQPSIYQEYVDTNYNRLYNTEVNQSNTRYPSSQPKYKKIIKIICVLGILITIIVLIMLFA